MAPARARVGGSQAPAALVQVQQPSAGLSAVAHQPRSAALQVKQELTACMDAAPPPAVIAASIPQAPAPRSWTPTKMPASSTVNRTPRLTPEEALEQEMSELSADSRVSGSAVVSAAAAGHGWQYGGNGNASAAAPGSPGYKRALQSNAYEGAAGEAVAGRTGSPTGGLPQPFAAQLHNNLVSGAAGSAWDSNEASGRASPAGPSKLKDMLTGHTAANNSITAVEAFTAADVQPVPAAAAAAGQAVVVAQRPGPKPRLAPSGHAATSARNEHQWLAELTACISVGDKLGALQLPGPSSGGLVRCYVKANSGLLGTSPSYELRLESSDQLLAVARRRKKSTSSFYLIGMGSNGSSITRSDEQLVGKLKANLFGSEFVLRGKGGDPTAKKGLNAQLLAVNYKPTVNHMESAPRTMSAVVPVPGAEAWGGYSTTGSEYDSLAACMEAARGRSLPPAYEHDLIMLHTMRPHWDPNKQVHYLDFKGRVTQMSLKNFQLVHWDHNTNQLGNDLVMLFGKRGGHEFAMDFCYPLNLLQAFALALSSIDSKMCFAM